MKLPLINKNDSDYGNNILNKYYSLKMIPSEKKTYITKLKDSIGPYMGIEAADGSTHFMLDAASQIATLGQGFNPPIFFGTTEFLESWINDSSSLEFKNARKAYTDFFARKLNWKKAYMTIAHSGAEANEIALGYSYQRRIYKEANKVLAFEGSFHGRMMVTLAATWNKSKREPFEWKNYLAQYVKYPEIDDNKINVSFPDLWRETWDKASLQNFTIPSSWESDIYIKKEIESLLAVREELLSKKIFAILVEPMQCEGGECYSTDRFHTALLLMAKTFKVPLIYDEVQTGFHLGREFFWHRQLDLKDISGKQLSPDYVVCAKKAQVGLVLSHKETKNIFKGEEFSVASFFRGYAHAISLDQSQDRIKNLEKKITAHLNSLLKKYPQHIRRPRSNGFAFAFDVNDSATMNKFVDLRFKHALLYYPAGNQTLRFRLSLAFGIKDIDFLFERLDAICRELFLNEKNELPKFVETDSTNADDLYNWHSFLIKIKRKKALGEKVEIKDIFTKASSFFNATNESSVELIDINADNFLSYREDIIHLQKKVYEPARQTDIEKFEHTLLDKNSLCLGLLNKKRKLVALAFAGPLYLYPLERGVRMDPYYNDKKTLYMLDLTVDPICHKSGFGRSLKYTLSAVAIAKGIKRIQGRNRDRLAASMLNINLSLGAVEQNYIKEDYPDFETHRDVFYYTTKVEWKKTTFPFSNAITMPHSLESLEDSYIDFQLPYLVNKVCLSNFVSEPFLKSIENFLSILPLDLRHAYTTSGQSECADKVVKTIWTKSHDRVKENNITKILTFDDHFFGNGSMFSRSLSLEDAPYFDVKKIKHPTENNYNEILTLVENELATNSYLSVWVEPLLQKTMEKTPFSFLKKLRALTIQYNVALVFNETAAQFYRYSNEYFMASCHPEISPDAGMIYCSGQAGIVFTSSRYYLEQPLMMISTWDGDEFHLLNYMHTFKKIVEQSKEYLKIAQKFQDKLILEISKYQIDSIHLEHGFGYFTGIIPHSITKRFIQNKNRYLVCPSYDVMKEYLNS